MRALKIDRVVVVHPSPYGADNAVSLDAMRVLGKRARGVAVIDETTTDAMLRAMHDAGVRGVRVNLESAGESDPAVARRLLQWAAERVATLGWHVQTYARLSVIAALHDTIMALPTILVIDHFGRAEAALGPDQPGLEKIYAQLASGKVYVKVSGAYRISQAPDFADVGADRARDDQSQSGPYCLGFGLAASWRRQGPGGARSRDYRAVPSPSMMARR